ncbi:MAG TPA: sigma-70 domain-containing protein, partial [Vulgatibacteraceae bacterium]|nr:sigma-70 domain-containing protein [Vulgatibacteraceae bacterium]
HRTDTRLSQTLGREATPEELAAELELPVQRVIALRQLLDDPVSLETPVGEGDSQFSDLIEDRNAERPEQVVGEGMKLEELAKELDMPPEKVVEVQKYGREPISLHTPLGEDGDSEFGDLIEDSEAIVPADAVSFTLLQEQLHSVLDTLSEREAGVVSMRFGLTDGQPKTLDEIGKVYGVTRERIRQIESKTMSKLRHPSRSQVLRDYLD